MVKKIGMGLGILAVLLVAAWFGLDRYFNPGGPSPQGMPTEAPTEPGWIDLLDAEHAPNWGNTKDDTEIFAIEDGVLHVFGRSKLTLRYVGYLAETFGDFDLHLEFKLGPRANSGLFLRAQKDDPVYRGFEVQVLEDHGDAPSTHSCGALYDIASPMYNMSRPAGEWNSYDISLHGGELIVFMNGWRVLHTDLDKMTEPLGKFPKPFAELPREGLIALQDHGGEAWYRNILIRPASASDAETATEATN